MTKLSTLIVLALSTVCAIPAIVIGVSNRLDVNPHRLRVEQAIDNARPAKEPGAAFVEPTVVTLSEVVIVGTNRSTTPAVVSKDEAVKDDDGSSCFVQESLVGGWVKVCE